MADSLTLTRENQKLRSENQELTVQTNELTIEVRQLAIKLEVVNDELAKIKSRFFGRASEKLSVEERQQMRLFDEAEQAAAENQEQPAPTEAATEVPTHTRCKPVRRPGCIPSA